MVEEKYSGIEDIEFRLCVSDYVIKKAYITLVNPHGKSNERALTITHEANVYIVNGLFPLDVLDVAGKYDISIKLIDKNNNEYVSDITGIEITEDLLPTMTKKFIEGLLDYEAESSMAKLL